MTVAGHAHERDRKAARRELPGHADHVPRVAAVAVDDEQAGGGRAARGGNDQVLDLGAVHLQELGRIFGGGAGAGLDARLERGAAAVGAMEVEPVGEPRMLRRRRSRMLEDRAVARGNARHQADEVGEVDVRRAIGARLAGIEVQNVARQAVEIEADRVGIPEVKLDGPGEIRDLRRPGPELRRIETARHGRAPLPRGSRRGPRWRDLGRGSGRRSLASVREHRRRRCAAAGGASRRPGRGEQRDRDLRRHPDHVNPGRPAFMVGCRRRGLPGGNHGARSVPFRKVGVLPGATGSRLGPWCFAPVRNIGGQ